MLTKDCQEDANDKPKNLLTHKPGNVDKEKIYIYLILEKDLYDTLTLFVLGPIYQTLTRVSAYQQNSTLSLTYRVRF